MCLQLLLCHRLFDSHFSDCVPLPAGDLLRDEVDSGSELGRRCEALMKEGTLVPQEVRGGTLRTLMTALGHTGVTPAVQRQPKSGSLTLTWALAMG